MVFTINVTNTSGDVGTLEPDVGFSYTDQLNRMNQATLKFSGLGVIRKGLLEVGSEIEILRNGVREFFGLTQEINFLEGGAVIVSVPGFEVWLGLENGVYANSPYTATASATIATDIITESNEFTAGTIEAGTVIDFRAQNTDSLYNALSNLVRKTQQDLAIDYPNLEVDVLDHKGSLTSVATLNAGIEISNVRIDQFFPRGNIVRVLGKSEGQTKVCATCCDASSIATFGCITLTCRDRTITTAAEAAKLAEAELAINKQPIKVYDFDVNNFDLAIVSGDELTLNARSQGIEAESVRTVGVERGVQANEEFMTLQVTNTEYARSLKRRNEVISEIEKASRQNEDYEQYEKEYSNQVCITCIGGVMTAGAGGSSQVTLDAGCIFAADSINIGGSSTNVFITGAGSVGGCLIMQQLCNPVTDFDAATKCYVDACVASGVGGDALWCCEAAQSFTVCDVDSSIIPNCSVGGANLNSVGTSTCPWDLMRGNCMLGVTCVCSPVVCGSTCVLGVVVCGTTSITTPILTVVSCAGIGTSPLSGVDLATVIACATTCVRTAVLCATSTGTAIIVAGDINFSGQDADNMNNLCVTDIFACGAGTAVCVNDTFCSGTNDDILIGSGAVLSSVGTNLAICGNGDAVVVGAISVGGLSNDLCVDNDFDVGGTKNAVVPYNGCKLAYSAIESPEIWFTEKCSSNLCKGCMEIMFDERFIGTTAIDNDHPIFVSLTPTSDSKGMSVKKMLDRVIIEELQNGKSDATFDIEISAKRKGFEDLRYRTDEFFEEIETWTKPATKQKIIDEMEDRKMDLLLRFLKSKQDVNMKKSSKRSQEFIDKFKNKSWLKKSLEVLKNA